MQGTPFFSPDGKRVAYVAFRGQQQCVVVDGRPSQEYEATLRGTPIFSPDSRRVAYAAAKGNRWNMYVDGQPGRQYEAIETLAFSRDGDHLAYVAGIGPKRLVFLDSTSSQPYDALLGSGPVFGTDGALGFFAVREGWLYRVKHPVGPGGKQAGRGATRK